MVGSREGLAIAELIFYFPALFVAIYVSYKHGFGRKKGWFFLILLALVRIIGAIAEIVYESSPSVGAYETFIICTSVGLSPLILCLLALILRVHEGMTGGPMIPQKVFYLLAIVPLIGLVLAIVGGTDETGSNNPSEVSQGVTLIRAAVILFLVVFLVLAGITLVTFAWARKIFPGDNVLLYAAALSLPFLFVRLLYAVLADFVTSTTKFSFINGDVVIQGCMATMEEFIVVVIFLTAGILVPKVQMSDIAPATNRRNGYGAAGLRTDQEMNNQTYDAGTEDKFDSRHQQRRGGRRSGRRRGGPIHMLINRFT